MQTYLLAWREIGGIFEARRHGCSFEPTIGRKDGKPHTYFTLVESDSNGAWSAAADRSRIGRAERGRAASLATDGDLSCSALRRVRNFRLFLDDEHAPLPDDPDVVRVRLGKVGWTNARAFGDVWLGLQLWRMVGLDEIVARHIPTGRETVPPATMVAIEVISRLCVGQGGETSEFALAEHGYRRTALEDLLGVPDESVTKDRLYRTLDALLAAKEPIEQALKDRSGSCSR